MKYDPKIVEKIDFLKWHLEVLTRLSIVAPDTTTYEYFAGKAEEARKEIESYGLLVQIKRGFTLDSSGMIRGVAEAHILKPKENLSPEDQKIYNEWFLRNAGIKTKGDQ
ncbi:MAG: hypothetical protein Q7R73_05220 [bacterium]|nr:hypothetical protein [bacterium]